MAWVLKIGFTSGPLVACGSWWQMDSCRGGWGDSCATFFGGSFVAVVFLSRAPTLPETNIASENGGPLEFRRFRAWKPSFSGANMLVSGRAFFLSRAFLNPKHLSGDHLSGHQQTLNEFASLYWKPPLFLTKCFVVVLNPRKSPFNGRFFFSAVVFPTIIGQSNQRALGQKFHAKSVANKNTWSLLGGSMWLYSIPSTSPK